MVQEVLTGYVGQQALARHLDSDEAVVLGSSLRAANLSDGIKLNRKLGMVDGVAYGIDIKLDGATLDAKDQGLLVPLHKNLPSKVRTFICFPLVLNVVLYCNYCITCCTWLQISFYRIGRAKYRSDNF